MGVSIRDGKDYLPQAKELIAEYAQRLGRDLSFQNLDEELNDIAAKYTAPEGEILVAVESGKALGMVAYHRHSGMRCEMKRLYVRPEARGMRLGELLVKEILAHAERAGYGEMVLDTIRPLQTAIHLYRKFGFEECEAYYENPMPDVIYMKKDLRLSKCGAIGMDLSNQKVLVVGLGISGVAAARLAKRFGAEVVVSDAKAEEKLGDEPKTLRAEGIRVECGPQDISLLEGVDHIIVSPAVPVRIPLLQEAYKRGMDVESEVEFAYHIAKSPILAITGTNGKTTTTTLLGKLMETAFPVVGVGGNIGVPLSEECLRVGKGGCVVAEISSYQMEATDDFVPHVAAVLNVTPDHVVRHGSLEVYQQMKEKMFARQTKDDFLVLNYDDSKTRGMAKRASGTVCFFSRKETPDEGAIVKDGVLTMRWHGKEIPILPVKELKIPGGHNVENALAAMAMAYLAGAEPEKIAEVLRNFESVEHRIEPVLTFENVAYYNDSKATNTDSSIKALESFEEPMVLLAGGDDKMTDLTEFMGLVKEKCRALVLVGNAAARFREAALAGGIPKDSIFEAGYSMEKAVELARAAAKPGDVVLLSPACASFDMYSGFEERGRNFKDIVRRMAQDSKGK